MNTAAGASACRGRRSNGGAEFVGVDDGSSVQDDDVGEIVRARRRGRAIGTELLIHRRDLVRQMQTDGIFTRIRQFAQCSKVDNRSGAQQVRLVGEGPVRRNIDRAVGESRVGKSVLEGARVLTRPPRGLDADDETARFTRT